MPYKIILSKGEGFYARVRRLQYIRLELAVITIYTIASYKTLHVFNPLNIGRVIRLSQKHRRQEESCKDDKPSMKQVRCVDLGSPHDTLHKFSLLVCAV